jgi:tetratricopeptide (TPR) repeat protein
VNSGAQPLGSNDLMNRIIKIIAYFPSLRVYLKGVIEFNCGNFEGALYYFAKGMKHPSFSNELTYSYYGQALCGLGQLHEGYNYLLKAYDIYERVSWKFKSEHELQLAENTLSALRHISRHTDIEIKQEILSKKLKRIPTKKST